MTERACVMQLDQDFIDGGYDVSCFCGWKAETCFDEREDAVDAFNGHVKAEKPAVQIR